MCMHWVSCLCWKETKSPSIAIGMFALVTSLMQLILAIAVFSSMNVDMSVITNPLYITLAVADFVVVLFSILLLIGLERKNECHRWAIFIWVIWIFIYIVYESAINIFLFSSAFKSPMPPNWQPFKGALIVFIVYWICKEIILFTGWYFIVTHMCYGETLAAIHYQDPTAVQVVSKDVYGPISYNGGVGQVQIRDNSPVAVATNFGAGRPSSSYQIYNSNFGVGGCNMPGQSCNLPVRYGCNMPGQSCNLPVKYM